MLFHLADQIDDVQFATIMQSINTAFWPEARYKDKQHLLPTWALPPGADRRLDEIRNSLQKITKEIADHVPLYELYKPESGDPEGFGLPFIDRYHQYFLQRQWEYPYRDPQFEYENLFRLAPEEKEDKSRAYVNYSRNHHDYNHFINVVAAIARLICFFSDTENTAKVIEKHEIAVQAPDELASQLTYGKEQQLRKFKLLLAAFYHDIGKTVEIHRHGMEGANILANHTTRAVSQFQQIVQAYSAQGANPDLKFDREDLFFIAHLIFYHDQFGTLGTGESGYLRLVDVIHRFRRYTINEDITEQRAGARRCLFDLWVLNLADIMVSLDGHKYELQRYLWERESAWEHIESFIQDPKAKALKHDLLVAMKLLDKHNESQHSDNLAALEQSALDYAKQHAVERVRRLLRALLVDRKKEYEKKFKTESPVYEILQEIFHFSEAKWNSTISRCIYSLGDYAEFIKRFSWIGQMDYAFGFFCKIAERALSHVNNELEALKEMGGRENCSNADMFVSKHSCTGWIYKPASLKLKEQPEDALPVRTNAEFFVDNFASTLIQILQHLLFREEEIARLRNLEFWVASQRLTDEKIDRIISLEGPFRTHHSVQLALESIYLW